MNIQDVNEARNRVKAMSIWIVRLDMLSALYVQGSIPIASGAFDMPLTNQQKNGIKARAVKVVTKLRALGDSFTETTGKIGTVDPKQVIQVEQNPPLAIEKMEKIQEMLGTAASIEPEEQEDGYGYNYPDADAESLANTLATTREQAKILITILESRLS